nr:hypothetical protein [Tanacetum cinerariifolium]
MTNLIQDNKHMEERLDSHGARLYTLENLDIPQQVSKAVDEIVIDAIDWAIQASLRNRFRDLPEADMKEILHQRITNSYKDHEDHMMMYEALEKFMNRDHTDKLLKDLVEARKKKKKRRDSSKTPPGSLPHQPPPPSPPAAPSSSNTAASVEYKAWTTTDTRIRPSISLTPKDLHIDDDMALDAQPLEEDRPATPEPAWSIPSSDLHVPKTNWASAIASTYSPPLEDSLLVQTGDMAMFMDCKPLPLGSPPGHVTIQSDFFFNKDLKYLRYSSKGSRPALLISKMKAAYYTDVGLEQMVPGQMWIEEECKYEIDTTYGISHWWFQRKQFYINRHTSEGIRRAVKTHMQILIVVRIEVFSMYGDGTLHQIDEALDYRVKEFKVNRMNSGLNIRIRDIRVKRIPLVHHIISFRRRFSFLDKRMWDLNVGFNSLVHSLRALSTLRCSSLRTASAAVKPCQGDSLELYMITGNRPRLLKSFLKSLTAMAYSSYSLSEVELSSSLDSFLAFKAIDLLCSLLLLTILETFLITSS